jgi:non-ribosomal peptide synthetase component E (peptide arylation enzyme)
VTGELLFSGPTVFNGYAGQTELECFIELDGVRYFRTGDLVELAAGGRQLRVVGRCKELINRGGEKISPAELDQLLEQLNNVAEVACYGYPDQRLGERVAAAVVVADGHRPPTLTELCDYLELCGVAKTKWPEQLNLVAALPRNPLGKVERFALAA